MSYDIYLRPACPDCGKAVNVPPDLDWNCTSNLSGMWRKAMPETDGLAGMDGMKAGDAAKVLALGIERMEADPAGYRAMNPENGWGDFDSHLPRLHYLLECFRNSPEAVVRVSR